MKKVVWPTKKQVINNTLIVLAVVPISAIVICGLDALFSLVIKLLIKARSAADEPGNSKINTKREGTKWLKKQNGMWCIPTRYENKVADSIVNAVENRQLHHLITDVKIPTEMVVEIKDDGQKVEKEQKLFPSYVFVKMIMTDDSWYVVRNIRGVTGFVGPGSKPVPLTEAEIERFQVENRRSRPTMPWATV